MALILNIETSTRVCSVSLARNGELISLKESRDEKSHATLLTLFIEEVLSSGKCEISELDAVAVSRGPGSYTGLRIGVSIAKGIVYGSGCKLLGINTLQAMASGVASKSFPSGHSGNVLLCPMIDARRMEVFMAIYTHDIRSFRDISAEIIHSGSFSDILSEYQIWFFGDGAGKCRNVINHHNAIFLNDIEPSAASMIALSEKAFQEQKFEDIAYFEPYYLKDFIATIPGKNVFPG